MPRDTDRSHARAQFWAGRPKGAYRCPGCDRTRNEVVTIDVHHRDGNAENNDPSNLVALCRRCHLGEQHDRPVDDSALEAPTPSSIDPRTPRNPTPGP